jgi:hypothetical protein
MPWFEFASSAAGRSETFGKLRRTDGVLPFALDLDDLPESGRLSGF